MNKAKCQATLSVTNQMAFSALIVALSWMAFQIVHECGHMIGAILSGGTVRAVVLHPLAISRTDVSPNPSPLIVVWAGPLFGSLFPFAAATPFRSKRSTWISTLRFFAGFCLVGNGAYIAIGSFDHVGDCRVMAQNGTPMWIMLAFGAVTIPLGLFVWHKLGHLEDLLNDKHQVEKSDTFVAAAIFLILVAMECVTS